MEFDQKHAEIRCPDPPTTYNSVREAGTYLLQSIGSDDKLARFTIIGFNPIFEVKITDEGAELSGEIAGEIQKPKGATTIETIREISKQLKCGTKIDAQFPGGLVGYVGYDIIRESVKLPNKKLDFPKAHLVLCKNNIIYDHHTKKTILTDLTTNGESDFEEITKDIFIGKPTPADCTAKKFSSNQTQEKFISAVEKAKHHIREGDIFQAVLSQRFSGEYAGDPFSAYTKLLEINPSPYMYYLDFGETHIAGSSPETLVRVEGKKTYTYPIAGTRRRGKDKAEDDKLEKNMRGDEKERAEHLMLVDLGRNDLGKVCEYGSVKVSKFMQTEYFSHVMHLSSEVEGVLNEDKDALDALDTVFPAGTVSGAPKVRAMEIIDELEPDARGIYAGCVGYIGFNGNLDTAITIRTIVFHKGIAHVQAGAGIVADSKPELEYKETKNKARGMLKTLGAEAEE
ncbi:MAG TPA: anthranilate synthase component I family protein [Candidatus Altiarchaeales archaeon]|nr:anthranilate synthase component I family protein [Candidatus Altiarchaeales archaeon]